MSKISNKRKKQSKSLVSERVMDSKDSDSRYGSRDANFEEGNQSVSDDSSSDVEVLDQFQTPDKALKECDNSSKKSSKHVCPSEGLKKLCTKYKGRSEVWKHFKKPPDGINECEGWALCTECNGGQWITRSDGSTTSMETHLLNQHKINIKNLQNNAIDTTFWKFHNYMTWDTMPYFLQQARNMILQDMLLRFKPSDELYGMASLMHIAYKKLSYLSNNEKNTIHEQFLYELFSDSNTPLDFDENITEIIDNYEQRYIIETANNNNNDDDNDCHLMINQVVPNQHIINAVNEQPVDARFIIFIEFKKYLNVNRILYTNKPDPLLWWKNHELEYPSVARLARKYLAIPASSAPAERVFSLCKITLEKKRWRMKIEMLEATLMLRCNKFLWNTD